MVHTPSSQTNAFFETSVRPILLDRCVSCHGPQQQKAGLRLDSREAVLVIGGDSGPPVIPGEPGESLLVEAIRYESYIKMPPDSKLTGGEIATLTDWVAMGAPWPVGPAIGGEPPGDTDAFDLDRRAGHWSLQPIVEPTIPAVERAEWVRNPIDRFILERLEAVGIGPAPEADRRSLIRRMSYGLIGLPPTPEEIDAFVGDDRPDAAERLIDRLLASPRYGERWGRHWLDLVRFAETSGHEFDYDILTAYRYRDYVIRAFNDDLPFDRFVIEHLAGDLLDEPRRHPTLGTNESILGTMAFFFAEGTHSPVDIREEMRTRVDNQIDVLGKAFLGLTVACARCHDHKFDAITTRDYYSLAGHLQSVRHQYAIIDPPERIADLVAELEAIRIELADEAAALAPPSADFHGTSPILMRDGDDLLDDFSGSSFNEWYPTGLAFGAGPTRSGDVMPAEEGDLLLLEPGWAHSGAIAPDLVGVLRSETFLIDRPYIHVLAAGEGGRINLVVDGFEKIRNPIYGGLSLAVDHGDHPRWITIDATMWIGHDGYLELADGAVSDYTRSTTAIQPGDGFLAVGVIVRSDHRDPPSLAEEIRPGPVRGRLDPGVLSSHAIELIGRYRGIAARIPEPTLALAAAEGTATDVPVHIRGSSRNLGAVVPRGFLEVLDRDGTAPAGDRLALARRIADPHNPLTSRVLVNRLWAHHFGRGIVSSPDDFGVMGDPPTHPELLDWLATEFIRSGWSIKHMHRLILASSSYRQASQRRPEAEAADPTNALLHRANLLRLEAEPLRDALLALSGQLDSTFFGLSVPPHLTPFMEGRGRPRRSGPLDGEGRRSIYLNIRRNFLPPFLLAFDFPTPASTRGRRDGSNVPSQALALMNDPFVLEQARKWAERATAEPGLPAGAIVDDLYSSAFARLPTPAERDRAIRFVRDHPDGNRKGWESLCHALINAKEFRYLD